MSKILRKYLDRQEKEDDIMADSLNKAVDAMSDRTTLQTTIVVLGIADLILWVAVVLRPLDVRSAFETVNALDSKIAAATIILVFFIGMFLTYAFLRSVYPDIEDQKLDNEILASFEYQTQSSKRFLVWLFSAIGGVINVLALVFMELVLTGN